MKSSIYLGAASVLMVCVLCSSAQADLQFPMTGAHYAAGSAITGYGEVGGEATVHILLKQGETVYGSVFVETVMQGGKWKYNFSLTPPAPGNVWPEGEVELIEMIDGEVTDTHTITIDP